MGGDEGEREGEEHSPINSGCVAASSRAGWRQHITYARDVRGLSGFGCLVFLLAVAAADVHLQR